MCHRILERIPTMTAEERQQLRQNCTRAGARTGDGLVVAEARRILEELDALEQREAAFIAKLDQARRIEYAFRRLPADDRQRDAIQWLHDHAGYAGAHGDDDCASHDWYRWFGTMCVDRRHLLHPEDPETACYDRAALEIAWASWLLAFGEDGRAKGLTSEAVAAFTTLGYLRRCA